MKIVKKMYIFVYQSRGMLIYIAINMFVYNFRFASGDWISLVWPTPATSWSLKMSVDLSQRNDIGSINHSPVSSMALNIIYPCFINQYVHIPGKKKSLFKYDIFNLNYKSISLYLEFESKISENRPSEKNICAHPYKT